MDQPLREPRRLLAVARSWWATAALTVVCLAVYLPGLTGLPTVDRDEARFAQASRQMANSPDSKGWVVPMIQDRPRLNKPPAIYWLQAGSARVFTRFTEGADEIWMYRLPSVIAAIVAVLATYRAGRVLFDARAAALGAGLLALCPLMVWESRQARADMVLLACCTVALWMAASLWTGRRPSNLRRVVLWAAVAAGVLTKGPILPMVLALAACSLAVVRRSWTPIRVLAPVRGMALVIASIGVWVVLVMEQVGVDTYLTIITDETLGRSLSPKEGHSGPPGYHTVLSAVLFWPGSMLTLLALGRAMRLGWPRTTAGGWRTAFSRRAGRPQELILLAWIIPTWIVFELIGTKLPHYTMPVYPAIALLSARGVLAAAAGSVPAFSSRSTRVGLWGFALIGVVMAATPWLLWQQFAGAADTWLLAAAFGALAVAGVLSIAGVRSVICAALPGRAFIGRRIVRGQLWTMAGAAALAIVLVGVVLPGLDRLWLTRRVVTLIRSADPDGNARIAGVRYHEDSMIFETNGRFERIDEPDLAGWISANPSGVLVLPAELAERFTSLKRVGEAEGFNYSRGRRERVVVCEVPR